MNTKEIRQKLMTAFNVTTSKQLKKHLTKTDLRSHAEMMHAAAVLWSYGDRYEIKDRNAVREVMYSVSEKEVMKLGYEAKHGFGSYACAA